MITDAARYHGIVLHYLVSRFGAPLQLEAIRDAASGFYLVEGHLPLYIKYSTSRKGPWSFTFQKSHRENIERFSALYHACAIAFCCGHDGVAGLRDSDLESMLGQSTDQPAGITVRRRHNEMYQAKGFLSTLERKISRSSLVDIIRDQITENK